MAKDPAPAPPDPASRVLVVEDDSVSRTLLERQLRGFGLEAVSTRNGEEAWALIETGNAPRLVILDWVMPGISGTDLCRRLREQATAVPYYVIFVSSRDSTEDVVAGLGSGADDYICKPWQVGELEARVATGRRMIALHQQLASRVTELETALETVEALKRLLPICSYCKRVRGDEDYWQEVEGYMERHARMQFTHGVCPDCYDAHARPQLEALRRQESSED